MAARVCALLDGICGEEVVCVPGLYDDMTNDPKKAFYQKRSFQSLSGNPANNFMNNYAFWNELYHI
jgi:hypothetical protein